MSEAADNVGGAVSGAAATMTDQAGLGLQQAATGLSVGTFQATGETSKAQKACQTQQGRAKRGSGRAPQRPWPICLDPEPDSSPHRLRAQPPASAARSSQPSCTAWQLAALLSQVAVRCHCRQ